MSGKAKVLFLLSNLIVLIAWITFGIHETFFKGLISIAIIFGNILVME
jgi:hypothetical protein